MLLLEAPKKKIVNDASWAVKRVTDLDIQVVTRKTLTELGDLSGILVERFAIEDQEGQEYLHLFCEHCHKIAICPHCGKIVTGGSDDKERSVRDLDIWGKRSIIHFSQRRFECTECNKPFTELLDWIDPKRRQTLRFEQFIYECIHKKKMSRKQVALQEGLHEETVLGIFKRWAKRSVRRSKRRRVRVLGIDEIYLGHKEYALILSDIERRRVIDVLPNRLKATLEKWLDELSKEERRAIKVVSMDMWKAYRQAVRSKLSHASIVADRFHVMKQLNHQLDLLRRNLRKNGDDALAELLKNSRWILLSNRCDLKPEDEAKLLHILDASDELRTVYLLKEEFRTLCDKIKDRDRAKRFLKAWLWRAEISTSRYLKRFAKTLRNWWHEFLNYFVGGVTQGFVEGSNRAIRGIINRAYGFHKFEHFRLHVLVECGGT
ncbi:MAG: ISL3 family transposase [Aestuariibacter sp.]|nr:ISL3 family transposase [Aestuariibacter sp.]